MTVFTGSGVAIVTPFKTDGSINYEIFEKLIEFQITNHTDAIIVCGTTGEASTLTDDEQIEAVRFAVSTAKKRVPIVAGAGSNDSAHGEQLCKAVEKAGADACLLVTPYYNKTSQKGLVTHYTAMAKATDLPIILYNVPSRTGLNITPKTCQQLSKIENIVAVKEASDNIVQIAEVAELCGDNLDIYSGNDNQIVPILSLGGKGVISVVANIIPQDTHDVVAKFLDGDIKGSLQLQLKMMGLVRSMFCDVNPVPVKKALNLIGYNVGGYRMPLVDMEENNVVFLQNELKAYGLL